MRRALVVIDVQESFRQAPTWPVISDPDIVDKVARLVEACRAAGDLVVWVLHEAPGSGTTFDPRNGHIRLIEPLAPLGGEPVVTKTSANAFSTTNLQQVLTREGVGELIVCGIQTERCCETTTRVASDFGYQVIFAIDATATFPIPHPSAVGMAPAEMLADPRTLSSADVIARTEYVLAGRFAAVRRIAEVIGA